MKQRPRKDRGEWYELNRERLNAIKKAYNKRYHAEMSLKNKAKRYGASVEEIQHILERTHCEICGTNDPGRGQTKWNIDHCHTTGKLRGALCHGCNMVIGFAKDNTTILNKAIAYLNERN